MKLQTIIRSVRLAAEGFLYLGIVLLCNKGIVPVCTIAFLLMAGNMTRLLAVIFLLAMIVYPLKPKNEYGNKNLQHIRPGNAGIVARHRARHNK